MNEIIPLMVIVPIACALLMNLFSGKNSLIKYLAITVAFIIPLIPLISNFGLHYFGGHAPLVNSLTGLLYHPAITYSFNSLSQLFIFLMGALTFFVVLIYLNMYKKFSGPYLFLIFMGVAAVTALMLSDDIFHIYVFYEIAVIAQVGIVIASTNEQRYETALKYMILSSIAGPLLLLGIGFLLAIFGSVNITDIAYSINHGLVDISAPIFLAAFGLIFCGWLYLSGNPPFHTIKSSMYSSAEPQGTALLQAFSVMIVVAFVIVMIRIFSGIEMFQYLLIGFSILQMMLGISMALVQTDFRRMLGYLAVGELGFVGLGLGLGTELSMAAGLFQAANEMVVTALLFIGFGAIIAITKTTNLNKIGGLIAYYPKTAIMILIGGFALAGVPPLNGFQSKLMLIKSFLDAGFPELAIITILISIGTFMVFVKIFYNVFLKPKPNSLEITNEKVPKSTIFTIAMLTLFCIVVGLVPSLLTGTFHSFVGGLL